jgi:hypothetical protein
VQLSWRGPAKAAAYVLAVAALLEGSARWFLANETCFPKVATAYTEPSWRLLWIHRHEQQGVLPFRFDELHPTRGWALKANLRDLPVFDGKQLNSNSRGLRGREEYEDPKPPGVVRILVFGDSFAFGEEVSDSETFCHRLADLLPGTQVLNFGVHGYGHDQMLIYLREQAQRYASDLVLLGYVSDDAERNLLGFRDFAKPRFRLRDGHLVLEGTPVPSPAELLRAEPRRSKLVDLVTMLVQQAAWRSGPRQREAGVLTLAILDAFMATVRTLGAEPVIIDMPVWNELRQTEPALTLREQAISAFSRARGVPYLALRPRFAVLAGTGVRLPTGTHWGPVEHQLAASAIADFLREEGLLRRAR